jgi:NAD(P)-dependent dehydrogenase (short-subunit alcohol dehydrogenase family)
MARVVMITGAAGHLGRAVAQAFAEQDDTLVLVDRERAALVQAFQAEQPRRLFVALDLLQPAAVDRGVQEVLARVGAIDVLCNLAGGFSMGPDVHATPAAAWQRMQELNVHTLLHASAAVVPGMLARQRGCIVNVGANAAQRGAAAMGAYIAAKAQVQRITESMAAELRDRGIRVNCVMPSVLDTPVNRADMPDADFTRWVAPAQLAAVIAFLASDAASAIHGAALPVTNRT